MIPEVVRKRYEMYIVSPTWKGIREKAILSVFQKGTAHDLDRGEFYCQECGWNFHKHELEVHHLHYRTLGHETERDLLVVCKSCHQKLDKIRAKQGKLRSIESLEEARLDGWASKIYGEDWLDYNDYDFIAEKFEQWLEKNEREN